MWMFYCLKIFDPKLIIDWCDDHQTARRTFKANEKILVLEEKNYNLGVR